MISYLEGVIEYKGDSFAIVNAGGIGYTITMIPKLLASLSKSQDKVKLFIHPRMNVREGTFDLFGFDSREDLDLFHMLISVSGIGPKNAMHILSTVEPKHLKAAVVNEDAGYLKKISGLGPKTAQRLILELQNKIEYLNLGDDLKIDLGQESHAMEALLALGYSQGQAKDALQQVPKKIDNLHDKVKEALKILGKNK
ncbi:MAG TPA: Holliday junction branch migration protein RuvA [Candidatus Paceibacterota bacterium]|nr:Holliday junction branch migration protein RuvA [Candidatus Paceibacterota bacterium]